MYLDASCDASARNAKDTPLQTDFGVLKGGYSYEIFFILLKGGVSLKISVQKGILFEHSLVFFFFGITTIPKPS